jgi:hypothetical protein
MPDFRDPEPLTANPYKSPLEVSEEGTEAKPQREAMAAWERLRLWYNAVLAGEVLLLVLLLSGHYALSLLKEDFKRVLGGALLANVCFCTGQVIEYYLGLIRLRGRAVRISIFIVGLLIAMQLTLLAILQIAYEFEMKHFPPL